MLKSRKEKPGVQTPWSSINQLLAADERFAVTSEGWQGYLLAPKRVSQLAALFYLLHQQHLSFSIQGRGTTEDEKISLPTLIVSARSFSQLAFHEQGIVEVGAGCSLSQLQSYLFEKKHEVGLEGDPLESTKRSVAGLILSGRTGGVQLRQEPLLSVLLGIELVTWEGSQLKWGGSYRSALAGPPLHKLMWGMKTLPGMITKFILKIYPIPLTRLQLVWSFREVERLWSHFCDLKSFSTTWERLDCVISEGFKQQKFILAQVSGLPEEMEAFQQLCPSYAEAREENKGQELKIFFSQQHLMAYPASQQQALAPGEYLWYQGLDQRAWWIRPRLVEKVSDQSMIWKQRLWESLYPTGQHHG